MSKIYNEYKYFSDQPRPMRLLLLTNFVYALVIPVIELFLSAWIIRKSNDISLVMVYQLAQGTGIPVTFVLNGYLLRRFPITTLYSVGMIISGVDMAIMMLLPELHLGGILIIGFIMGLSYGFFWANRVFLALNTTTDANRNYYYGLEALGFTVASVIMPLLAGYLIASTQKLGWFGGQPRYAYYILTGIVILLTILASIIIHRGRYSNPPRSRFIYFKFHRLWYKMLRLAALKGIAQGFIIAAPVMLIMRLVGNEGSVGSIQSVGALLSSGMLYVLGRRSSPKQRIGIFAAGLFLFFIGSLTNLIFFNATAAIVFVGCLVFARPLLDLAYFPIQLGVIECVASREKRYQFAYIFNHEIGIYIGRLTGCLLFILISRNVSEEAALRYALAGVALAQCLSLIVARSITTDSEWCEASPKVSMDPQMMKEPGELISAQ